MVNDLPGVSALGEMRFQRNRSSLPTLKCLAIEASVSPRRMVYWILFGDFWTLATFFGESPAFPGFASPLLAVLIAEATSSRVPAAILSERK